VLFSVKVEILMRHFGDGLVLYVHKLAKL